MTVPNPKSESITLSPTLNFLSMCVFLFDPANIRNILTIDGMGENYFLSFVIGLKPCKLPFCAEMGYLLFDDVGVCYYGLPE
jgi:hypothetical protein